MAKLSDLILRTAETTGIPEPTVREIGRRLREAGLIQTGKGGRYGGAEMTPNDAACLLTGLLIAKASSPSFADIAVLTKSHLKDLTSHNTGRGHRIIHARWDSRLGLSELRKLKRGHAFGEAFAALIASFVNGEFKQRMTKWGWVSVEVKIYSPRPLAFRAAEPEAEIAFETEAFGDVGLHFIRHRSAERVEDITSSSWSQINEGSDCDLIVGAEITQITLKSMGFVAAKL